MKRLLFLCIISLALFSSCREVFGKRIRGNGRVQTETRSVSGFNSIEVSGSFDVYIKQDSVQSVKLETDENLMKYIEIQEEGNVLKIYPKNNLRLKPSRTIKVFLTGQDFRRFEAAGACDFFSENQVKADATVEIGLSGACNAKMDIHAPEVKAELSGAGQLDLKGETRDFSVKGSGATDIKCFDLMAENVDVHISGAGDAQVFASVKLNVQVTGAGSVKYRGNATVSQKVSGAGSVKKVD